MHQTGELAFQVAMRPRWGRGLMSALLSAGQDLRLSTCDLFEVLFHSATSLSSFSIVRPQRGPCAICYIIPFYFGVWKIIIIFALKEHEGTMSRQL